ncbi:hypothetical protein ACWDTG_26375 [Rhodococcus zopfii]
MRVEDPEGFRRGPSVQGQFLRAVENTKMVVFDDDVHDDPRMDRTDANTLSRDHHSPALRNPTLDGLRACCWRRGQRGGCLPNSGQTTDLVDPEGVRHRLDEMVSGDGVDQTSIDAQCDTSAGGVDPELELMPPHDHNAVAVRGAVDLDRTESLISSGDVDRCHWHVPLE